MNKPPFLIFALWFYYSPSSHAQCAHIADGLKEKIEEFKSFRAKNETALQTLLQNEAHCKETGAKISGKIASMAEATSCQAQLDASHMNQEMVAVGEECEGIFRKINGIQAATRSAFEEVKTDLDAGAEYMMKSEILNKYCKEEIQYAKKLVTRFVALEEGIHQVEARSLDGKINYGKFRNTAEDLRTATAKRNTKCGELAPVSLPASVSNSAITKATKPVPAGRDSHTTSDITGTRHAKEEAELAKKIMDQQNPEKNFTVIKHQLGGKDLPSSPKGNREDIASFNQKSSSDLLGDYFGKETISEIAMGPHQITPTAADDHEASSPGSKKLEDPSNILKEHPQTLSSPSNVAMAEPMDRKPAAVDAPFSWSGELASRDPSHEASSGMEEESLFRRVKKAHQRSKLQERQNLVAAANPR